MKLTIWLHCLALFYPWTEVSGDMYTSLVDMEQLVHLQNTLVEFMGYYLRVMDTNLLKLKHYMAKIELEHNQASRGIQHYLSNPINAYLMTKRLTSDWWGATTLITDKVGQDLVQTIWRYREQYPDFYPTTDDLIGAARGVLRIQNIYRQLPFDLANGKINGLQLRDPLSSSDCYEMSKISFMSDQYFLARLWIKEAFHMYHKEVNKTINLNNIFEGLSVNYFLEGKPKVALKLINKIQETEHGDKYTTEYRTVFRNSLIGAGKSFNGSNIEDIVNRTNTDSLEKIIGNTLSKLEWAKYRDLCSGRVTLDEKKKSQLRCRYVDFGRPQLILAKLKEEEACLNPRIVVYHDVIYDREIDVLKELSNRSLKPAGVLSVGGIIYGNYRSGKNIFLPDEMHPRLRELSRRVEHITGLCIKSSEHLQVVNYGVGGHYGPHYDFEGLENPLDPFTRVYGKRIATVVFYMSDVAHGGATIFPRLNVTVYPRKGTALIWYNLLKNGNYDYRTRHASCPVLLGDKWICTKWLHEVGQEFRRLCGLHYNDV